MIASVQRLSQYALLILLVGCSPLQPPERVGAGDLSPRLLTGRTSVVAKDGSGFSTLTVLVTVGVDGHVVDARVGENLYELDPRPGLSAARAMTFKPLIFEGRPVQAIGKIKIEYQVPEIPADTSAPFPDAPLEDFEITLERSGCFGSCPAYRVSINGSGLVRYESPKNPFPAPEKDIHVAMNGSNTLLSGPYETRVDPKAVAGLIAKFRDAHFMGLKPSYVASVTDNPTYVLTLRAGKTVKRVVDYVGRSAGMPESVKTLEEAVDTLAGSERWTRGNGETVALLKSKGFNFKSTDAAYLVAGAMVWSYRAPDDKRAIGFIRAMLAAGLDLNTMVDSYAGQKSVPISASIVKFVAEAGDDQFLTHLADSGYLKSVDTKDLDEAMRSSMGCNPAVPAILVKLGANPKAPGPEGNALHQVRESYGACAEVGSARRVEMTKALVALGVPLEARDSIKWTPLMGNDDPDVVGVLIAAGANLNARDEDGTTPALATSDDRVLLMLLRAGADPRAKDRNGSVRDQARQGHMPASLKWLAEHGIK